MARLHSPNRMIAMRIALTVGGSLLAGLLTACLPQNTDATPRGGSGKSADGCRAPRNVFAPSRVDAPGHQLRNGAVAEASQFPATGMLFYSDASKSSVCTGTLVCSNVVLTAAHCFDGFAAKGYSFHLGSEVLAKGKTSPSDRATAPRGEVVLLRDKNALDSSVATGADIALLKLDKAVSGQSAAMVVDRVNESELRQTKVALTLVGYGNNAGDSADSQTGSGVKRFGQMRLVAHEAADTDPSGLQLGVLDPISAENGIKSCHGDSGGPAFLGTEIYGVVAVSDKSCQNGTLTAISLVAENQSWLKGNLAELCQGEPAKMVRSGVGPENVAGDSGGGTNATVDAVDGVAGTPDDNDEKCL